MSATTTAVKVNDFEWETYEGETEGVYGDYEYEVGIAAAAKGSLKWGETASNVRAWIAYGAGRVEIARGEAKDLRTAKRDAVAAINAAA